MILPLVIFADNPGKEGGKVSNVAIDARFFKGVHIIVPKVLGYDCPSVTAGSEHEIHKETPHSSVSVHVRVDESKDEVS